MRIRLIHGGAVPIRDVTGVGPGVDSKCSYQPVGRVVTEEIRKIADRMRAWRLELGWTLQELAERAGVSASAIHKIENHQTVPTIRVLLKVASGLGREPHQLFGSGEVEVTPNCVAVHRAEESRAWSSPSGVDLEKVVGPIGGAVVDLWRLRHPPGTSSRSDSSHPWRSYAGEIVILIETGELDVNVDGEEWQLGPGDTIHLDTVRPHRWENRSESPASFLLFCLTSDAARLLKEPE